MLTAFLVAIGWICLRVLIYFCLMALAVWKLIPRRITLIWIDRVIDGGIYPWTIWSKEWMNQFYYQPKITMRDVRIAYRRGRLACGFSVP